MIRCLHKHPAADFILGPSYEPTTLAMIALATAATGAGVASYGAYQQGKATKAAADFQAEALKTQAAQERANAATNEEDFRKKQSRLMASRRAILGGSGIDQGEGSPLLVSEDLANETEIQALRIRSGGEMVASRLESDASLQRMRGKAGLTEGYMRSGASLLSGAGQAFGQSALIKSGLYDRA